MTLKPLAVAASMAPAYLSPHVVPGTEWLLIGSRTVLAPSVLWNPLRMALALALTVS
jgi:hypothetical protein